MEGVELVWASNFRSPHLTLGAARSALRVAVSIVPHGISCRWCHVAAPFPLIRSQRLVFMGCCLQACSHAVTQGAMPIIPVLAGLLQLVQATAVLLCHSRANTWRTCRLETC